MAPPMGDGKDPGAHVLVVDDEVAACEPIVAYLSKNGYRAASANNGIDAVDYVRDHLPEVVILDIKMPEMNGMDALEKIREFNGDCVIIMLSAVDDVGVALDTIHKGADDYLRKPVELAELTHRVESCLEKRRLIRENRDYQNNLESKVAEQTKSLQTLNEQLKKANLEIVLALSEAIEAKDPYTRGHCRRVAELSLALGKELALNAGEMESLHYGALLHDIGKIGIRGAVLNKPGKLTKEEYDHVKLHPVIGDKIVSNIGYLDGARQVVRHHHERHDGTGYPDGLDGAGHSVLVSIAIIADSYDAMTSHRPYRKAMGHERTVTLMNESRGTQFDPDLLDIFNKQVVGR